MPEKPRTTIRLADQPYVGQLGETNTLKVDHRPDRTVCHVSGGSVWFRQIMVLVWGLFLSFMLWTSLEERRFHIPLPFSIIVWVLAIACWAIFVRTLMGTPRVEVLGASGDFYFYRFNTRAPSRIIKRAEVKRIAVETQFYTYKSSQTVNYLACLYLEGDQKVPLCASPTEQVIRLLETQLTTGIGARRE
jgi:hypothetical protein